MDSQETLHQAVKAARQELADLVSRFTQVLRNLVENASGADDAGEAGGGTNGTATKAEDSTKSTSVARAQQGASTGSAADAVQGAGNSVAKRPQAVLDATGSTTASAGAASLGDSASSSAGTARVGTTTSGANPSTQPSAQRDGETIESGANSSRAASAGGVAAATPATEDEGSFEIKRRIAKLRAAMKAVLDAHIQRESERKAADDAISDAEVASMQKRRADLQFQIRDQNERLKLVIEQLRSLHADLTLLASAKKESMKVPTPAQTAVSKPVS